MMLEQAKQDEHNLESDMQTLQTSVTRSSTEIQPQLPWSRGGVNQWKPFRVLDMGVRPSSLATQPDGQPVKIHALTDYQKQLVLLEKQNQFRLKQARLAHRSQGPSATDNGVTTATSPTSTSTEGDIFTPPTSNESRSPRSRPWTRTGRSAS